MAIKNLNHFTFPTHDIDACIHFYSTVVGLTQGDNLGGTPGAYFYIDGNPMPVVHIIDAKAYQAGNSDFILNATTAAKGNQDFLTGSLDHIAFGIDMTDYDATLSRITENQVKHHIGNDFVPQLKQIWLLDPNGIKIELNFYHGDSLSP